MICSMTGDDPLLVLRGHFDTVSFVMDYVEFRIDYNILRVMTGPIVELADGRRGRFPEPGSRDLLCELIDSEVISAVEIGAEDPKTHRVEVRTSNGDLLVVPLDAQSRAGYEGAHLVPADESGRLDTGGTIIW
jgi:hypothetical protein